MTTIKLTRGYVALIDNCDWAKLADFKWWAKPLRNTVYACSRVNGKFVYMHRLILGVIDSRIEVDHLDGNGLNNWRSNLRIATRSLNQRNLHKPSVGVRQLPSGSWTARLQSKVNGKKQPDLFFKTYPTRQEAVDGYNAAAARHGFLTRTQ